MFQSKLDLSSYVTNISSNKSLRIIEKYLDETQKLGGGPILPSNDKMNNNLVENI
jgi:hypothetical protein